MINNKRSQFLAAQDPALAVFRNDLQLSWLDDVSAATAAARQVELLQVYVNVQVGPAYDGNGELMPERRSIWIDHPPIAQPLEPVTGPPPVPPDAPSPPPGSPSAGGSPGDATPPRLGLSVFGLIPASTSWARDAVSFAMDRGFTRLRVWGDWDRPSSASRMLAANGTVDMTMLSSFVARGTAAGQAGATFNLSFGTGAGRYTSVAAQATGIATILAALAGAEWIDYVDVANEWTETMTAAQVAVILDACRTADPDRKLTASISGSPAVVATNVAAIYAAGAELDYVAPHYPRDANWMHTGPRVRLTASLLGSQQIVVPFVLEEENRVHTTGSYEPRSADEFYTAAIEGIQVGAREFTVHTQAGYLPANGSFQSQLIAPIEPEVTSQIALRVAAALR